MEGQDKDREGTEVWARVRAKIACQGSEYSVRIRTKAVF
jgi:hypothetical protein